MSWVYAITLALTALSSLLAWAAKIWWTQEQIAAKDEIIRAKEAQVGLLSTAKDETIKSKEGEIRFLKDQVENWKAVKDETLRARQEIVERLEKHIESLTVVQAETVSALEKQIEGLKAVQAETVSVFDARMRLQLETKEYLNDIIAKKDIDIKRLDDRLRKRKRKGEKGWSLLETQLVREIVAQDKDLLSNILSTTQQAPDEKALGEGLFQKIRESSEPIRELIKLMRNNALPNLLSETRKFVEQENGEKDEKEEK
jgi:predicted XRE-type DNA-binding protein